MTPILHYINPTKWKASDALTQEDPRMEATLLQALVIHYVSAALPVEQLHQFAAAANKNVHITVGGLQAHAPHLAT